MVQRILERLEIDSATYRLGLSQVSKIEFEYITWSLFVSHEIDDGERVYDTSEM